MAAFDDTDNPVDPGDGSGGASYPPIVGNGSLPNGTIGTAYNQQLYAYYGTGTYTWSITAGALPSGITLAGSTGILSGTPNTAGTSFFVVTVADSSGATGAANLSISIPSQPSIQNSSLPGATVGVPYTASLSGTGGASPYTFSITAGSLPAGLTLASTGGITGTPSTQGTYTFTVEIADSSATPATSSANFSITVGRASLSSSVRSMDDTVLIGGSDGALYMIVPGQQHDQDYYGNSVGFLQVWEGVPTSSSKLGLNQFGGATVSARGNGNLNVSVRDDSGTLTPLSGVKRPMVLNRLKETARDFMAKAMPHSIRYAPRLDNGGAIDAWFEAHVFMLWMRPFWNGRKG